MEEQGGSAYLERRAHRPEVRSIERAPHGGRAPRSGAAGVGDVG
jgi:hypothetical protein